MEMIGRCLLIVGFFLSSMNGIASAEENFSGDDRVSKEEMIYLLVDKQKLKADLMTWGNTKDKSEKLMSYRIAIGKAEGDKQREGDNKTPEGIYITQEIIDGRGLPAKYGPFAIPIDFPNPPDLAAKKTGYGIWLHGVEKDKRIEAAKVTEGCVAFYNSDIVMLKSWLRPFQGVVVIADTTEGVNRESDVASVLEHTKEWYAAWQNRNIANYLDAYHQDFRYKRMNRRLFSKYKERVFSKYKEMNVDISNIRVFSHEKYAMAIMNQNFNGDNRYVTQGRKILYWNRTEDGGWKIRHEVFERRRLKFSNYSQMEFARLRLDSPSSKSLKTKSL